MNRDEELTRLINLMGSGDTDSRREVLGRIYPKLLDVARGMHRDFGLGEITQSRELLSEALVRLAGLKREWSDRNHFLSTFAAAVRSVRVNDFRRRNRAGEATIDDLDAFVATGEGDHWRLMDLNDALNRLEDEHSDAGRIATMHAFLNLTQAEIAEDLGLPLSRVRRIWDLSKNRLSVYLSSYGDPA